MIVPLRGRTRVSEVNFLEAKYDAHYALSMVRIQELDENFQSSKILFQPLKSAHRYWQNIKSVKQESFKGAYFSSSSILFSALSFTLVVEMVTLDVIWAFQDSLLC